MKITKSLGAKTLIASAVAVAWVAMEQAAVSNPHATASDPHAVALAHSGGMPIPAVTPQDARQLARLRTAGLRRDGTAVAALIGSLNDPPHPDYTKTALHSLARLGATDAIPAIDHTINTGDADTACYARASKDRLIAEDAARNVAGAAGTAVKIDVLYRELGETPEQINAAVAAHYDNGGDSTDPQPVEVYALRELADIVYSGAKDSSAMAVLPPNAAALNFRLDPPAALKMKIAALPPGMRLPSLIQGLSQKKMLGADEYFEMQLAADEGLPASRAAAAQLTRMEADRTQVTPDGCIALLQVIHAVGDKSQVPLFARLMAGANVEFMYPDVKNGEPQQIVPGY